MKQKIVIIAGQTGTGKSDLAIDLSLKFAGEIINCDSQQVYRFMDIGTSKVSKDKRKIVPHHLLDILNPDDEYNASLFALDAGKAIEDISARGKNPFIVGGTGLYIKCLLGGVFKIPGDTGEIRSKLEKRLLEEGSTPLWEELNSIDPESAKKISKNDKQRILRALEVYLATGEKISSLQKSHGFREEKYSYIKIGLKVDRTVLLERLKKRVESMFNEGLLSEVETLLNKGYKSDFKPLLSIGYKEAVMVLAKKIDLAAAKELVFKRTKDYAKRQMTWFKKDNDFKWFNPLTEKSLIASAVQEFLDS
jgi:tRNA dimethylallyltransferase